MADDTQLDDVELEPTEGLRLRISGPLDRRPSQAKVRLVDDEGLAVSERQLLAGADGWMYFGSAPKGTWRLLVQGDGLVALGESVTVPGPALDLIGHDGPRLRIEVPEIKHGRLEILDWQGRPLLVESYSRFPLQILTLPPGSFTVRVTSGDRAFTSPVELLPGGFEALQFSEEPP